jgi:hypothetical protein
VRFFGQCDGGGFTEIDMPVENLLDRFPQVLEQVKAVGDLDGARCTPRGTIRVGSGAITADDFHAGVFD